MKKRIFIFLLSAIAVLTTLCAQAITIDKTSVDSTTRAISTRARFITGTVTDDKGWPLIGATIVLKGTTRGCTTDIDGAFFLEIFNGEATLVCSYVGYTQVEYKVGVCNVVNIRLKESESVLEELVVTSIGIKSDRKTAMGYSYALMGGASSRHRRKQKKAKPQKEIVRISASSNMTKKQKRQARHERDSLKQIAQFNTEEYGYWVENDYKFPKNEPLSTFSIDVDRASYANVRRFLNNGTKPPSGAVRIEEMVNYFDYNYPQPQEASGHPLSITTEIGACPWNETHLLLHIGLQGKKMDLAKAPKNNLVFLIDVSGSMDEPNKLPLVKDALRILIKSLREEDQVAIVVYAGAAGCVLPTTSGAQKEKMLEALDGLNAGGSTAGGEGIQLAYKIAKENFVKNGNNRIILATDGDFNVGVSSESELVDMIVAKRKEDIFLSVLGFGMGNYKDNKMELLADKGNGNYAYIDNIDEAKKILGKEMGGTLYTIAKDVKLQLEFNPSVVESYRLIGYENRLLNKEDFNDDTKDAGEIGAGHTVTALYEIVPKGAETTALESPTVDKLRYQEMKNKAASNRNEMVFVKLRYKKPNGFKSIIMEQTVENQGHSLAQTTDNFRFSAAVAGFAQILRGSKYIGDFDLMKAKTLAEGSFGADTEGYRVAFVKLINKAERLGFTAKN